MVFYMIFVDFFIDIKQIYINAYTSRKDILRMDFLTFPIHNPIKSQTKKQKYNKNTENDNRKSYLNVQ